MKLSSHLEDEYCVCFVCKGIKVIEAQNEGSQ